LGSLIAEGAAQINPIRVYWWMIAFPAGCLAAFLMALNFLGDGLRDVFDPKADKDCWVTKRLVKRVFVGKR